MAWYKDAERKIRADIPPISSTEVKILGNIGPIIDLDHPKFVQPKNINSTSATVTISSTNIKTFSVPMTAASAKFYKVKYTKPTISALSSISSFQ
jgi:hypothetical protein